MGRLLMIYSSSLCKAARRMPSPWTTLDPNQVQPDWLNAQCPREGRYVIGPLLGRGGMGDVHEAWDVVLCRTVALKILKDIEPTALIRFMHEAQIHARVVHPNICRIYDVDNYEGTLRVAMQLVRGPNLEQACRELSRKEVVTIMALVAQAVDVVHRLKLIHRDLKPSNILLERNSEGRWTPFVCDFGLAMALDEPALTYSHGVLGTPAYMAPEQFRGERDQITAATDIYALGGTLHFALTGQQPGGPTGPRQSEAGTRALPRDLRIIIAKCLEADPALRYPSASALGEDLWRFLEGDPIRAGEHTLRTRLRRQWNRAQVLLRPWLPPLASALVVGAVLLVRQDRLEQRDRRLQAEAQELALGAAAMELDMRQEQMLAVHDLRPSYARIRDRTAQDRARVQALPPPWQATGRYALGVAAYLLRDYPGARGELVAAWQGGFRSAAVARLLATAGIAAAGQGGPPDPGLEAVLRTSQELDRDSGEALDTLASFLRGDYQGAATKANASFQLSPWRNRARALEANCLVSQARQDLAAGDLPKALARHQEAVAAAAAVLPAHPCSPELRHAQLQAALGLAAILREQGRLTPAFLGELQADCATALRLDPADPELLADRLALEALKAMRLADLGRDPLPVLEAALALEDAWAREPLSPALDSDRMLLCWLLAERQEARGEDPEPALAEALRHAGHTPWMPRDCYWEVLACRARAAERAGRDPRPALADLLAQLEPQLQKNPTWALKEAAAAAWLARARWEAAHGLDPAPGIRSAREQLEGARGRSPASPSALALEGLADLQEGRAAPDGGQLLRQAQEHLRASLALGFGGRPQALLKASLARHSVPPAMDME